MGDLKTTLEPILAERLKRPQDAQKVAELVATTVSVSGPLPPASEMAGYEHAVPGSGDRIIKMAEREQEFQHRMMGREMSIAEGETQTNNRVVVTGQLVGATVVMVLVFGGLGLTALEYEVTGYTGFATGILLYVSSWVMGRPIGRTRTRDNGREKDEQKRR